MSRIAYVNGRYLPLDAPAVRVEDRGFQFADGVYEVWAVRRGRLKDERGHMERLYRSLKKLDIPAPMGEGALLAVLRETMRRNRVSDGLVYLQVTRGAARRDHAFPDPRPRPTIVVTSRAVNAAAVDARAEAGVAVISYPDERWKHCDIKSISLLPNVLAKQAARASGAYEAWLIDEQGYVTEGASSTAWILTADGALVTRPTDNLILHGITRAAIFPLAEAEGWRIEERAFKLDEAFAAREAFITSANSFVTPVVRIDGEPVGEGRPGAFSVALRRRYAATA